MIITKTPFRISFLGGGTDLPDWYKKNEGCVLSCTINKYTYIIIRDLPKLFKYNFRLRYFKTEEVTKVSQILHKTYKESFKLARIQNNCIELVHNADIPSLSGLASSSSNSVGTINALFLYKKKKLNKKALSKIAIKLEQEILKESVGSQDQIACSYGGFNFIKFYKNDFKVYPIKNKRSKKKISESLLLFYTGIQRNAQLIEKKKIKRIKKNLNDSYLKKINEITLNAYKQIESSRFTIEDFGKYINEYWKLKKKLSNSVSNKFIDTLINRGIKAGALGAKLLGAGAGGFLLFVCQKKKIN